MNLNLVSRFFALFNRPRPMDNITACAGQAFALARRVATARKLEEVDIDHVVIGLLRLNHGIALHVLMGLGIDRAIMMADLERLIKDGSSSIEAMKVPYNRSIKLSLALGVQEAEKMKNAYFGTDHILLGLLRYGKGSAYDWLITHGVTFDSARTLVLKLQAEDRAKDPSQSRELIVAVVPVVDTPLSKPV